MGHKKKDNMFFRHPILDHELYLYVKQTTSTFLYRYNTEGLRYLGMQDQLVKFHLLRGSAYPQDLFEYAGCFEEDTLHAGIKPGAHPAEPVAYFLGSNNPSNNDLRMQQMERWFMEYQTKRGHQFTIFKSAREIVRGSTRYMQSVDFVT